jgi:hypothetical protein
LLDLLALMAVAGHVFTVVVVVDNVHASANCGQAAAGSTTWPSTLGGRTGIGPL